MPQIKKGGIAMKKVIIVLAILLLSVSIVLAAGPKTYQVTGPVLEMTDDSITVQKGKEKWQIARDKDTKVKGELKVGAKVTIEYTMKAAAVEVKGESKKK
jgi:RNase P/RNase MRP subunit p29